MLSTQQIIEALRDYEVFTAASKSKYDVDKLSLLCAYAIGKTLSTVQLMDLGNELADMQQSKA